MHKKWTKNLHGEHQLCLKISQTLEPTPDGSIPKEYQLKLLDNPENIIHMTNLSLINVRSVFLFQDK